MLYFRQVEHLRILVLIHVQWLLTWDRMYQSLIPARVSRRMVNHFCLKSCSLQNNKQTKTFTESRWKKHTQIYFALKEASTHSSVKNIT